MSTPRHSSLPQELQEALQEKSVEEQERIRQVWQLLGYLEQEDYSVDQLDIPDTESALTTLETQIDVDQSTQKPLRSFSGDRLPNRAAWQKNSRSMQWTTIAASVMLVLFATMIWYWRTPVVIKAPLGEQITAVLPDHSTVTLNSGSRIEYPRRFESWPLIDTNKRRVFLQGEGFFEIQEMEKPFVVESFNAHVRVLGTKFNVWAREHDSFPETRVTLASGSVLVTPRNQDDLKTTLEQPGQMVRVVSGSDGSAHHTEDLVPVGQASAWRSNGFSAIDISMATIVEEIERQYDIQIQVDSNLNSAKTLTLFIQDKQSAEQLIEAVCLSAGCQYRQTNNGFNIFPISAQ